MRTRGETGKPMREERFVTSFAQRGFWLANEVEPESPVFNVARAFRVSGPLDFRVLTEAFDLIVQRHEALRTSFSESFGEVFQYVEHDISLNIDRFDLSERRERDQEA